MEIPFAGPLVNLLLLRRKESKAATATRERVASEAKVNLDILRRYSDRIASSNNKATRATLKGRAIESIHLAALQKAIDSDVPLGDVFDDELVRPDLRTPTKSHKLRLYTRWIKEDQTTADLLRRIQMRVTVSKQWTQNGTPTGDLGYLEFMLLTFLISLPKR